MDRRGITLIELLIVMAIMAILVTLVARASTSKSAAALAVLKSDLRNVAVAQEAYFATGGVYAGGPEDLDVEMSELVTLELRASARGWSGRTVHTLKEDFQCALFVGGGVAPFEPAAEEGLIACRPKVGGGGCFGG